MTNVSRWSILLCVLTACGDDGAAPAGTEGDASSTDTAASSTDASSSSGPTSSTSSTSSSDASSTSSSDASSDGSESSGGSACDGATLRELPGDPGARGPWTVGVRTVTIDGLGVEVWYPSPPGSERGADPVVYDIRDHLPDSEQGKISDEDNPPQPCDCFRDLPIDDGYGPYPAIVFVHGTASFRTQSLPQMVHWASRGFVVLATDHPGLRLRDTLGAVCGAGNVPQSLPADLDALVGAVRDNAASLGDLADHIDGTRIGLAGHSAGGTAVGSRGDDARVIIPLAAGGTSPGTMLASTLVMGGTDDSVVAYMQQQEGYASSPRPKRFVGIEGGGHLSFSEICSLENAAGQNLLEIATDNGVCGAQLAGFLFQCSPDLIADADAWAIIDYATTAAFEEVLQCADIGDAFADIESMFPGVAEFAEE